MGEFLRVRVPVLLVILFLIFTAAVPAHAAQADPLAKVFAAIRSGDISVIDLTHELDGESPYWPEGKAQTPFHAEVVATFPKYGYFARAISLPEHFGTHMDAPAHFDPDGSTVDQILPRELLVPAVVVDVRQQVKADQDYRVSVADLQRWEHAHRAWPAGAAVFIFTGWSSRWPSQEKYMNQDAQGVLHFPGLSVEAAKYLVEHAHPVAIGIDTGSIDYGPSKNFEAHHVTMKAGLYHLENLANLDRLPARGAYIIALPMKLRGGSGSPTRVVALMPKR